MKGGSGRLPSDDSSDRNTSIEPEAVKWRKGWGSDPQIKFFHVLRRPRLVGTLSPPQLRVQPSQISWTDAVWISQIEISFPGLS